MRVSSSSKAKALLAACEYIVAESARICALPERPEVTRGICGLLIYRGGYGDALRDRKLASSVYCAMGHFIDGAVYINADYGWSPERETVLAMLAALTAEELFEIITSEKL